MHEVTEGTVKKMVRDWFKSRGGWCFSPVSNGMGAHGIPDIIGCVPMGAYGVFVAVECKRPGLRQQEGRGATPLQLMQIAGIHRANGIALVCDGPEDLAALSTFLTTLGNGDMPLCGTS